MSHHDDKANWSADTKCIHAGQAPDPVFGAVAPPIYQTSTFAFESTAQGAARFAGTDKGYIYTRLGNPTTRMLEDNLAALEGGACALATSSGMAAISTLFFRMPVGGRPRGVQPGRLRTLQAGAREGLLALRGHGLHGGNQRPGGHAGRHDGPDQDGLHRNAFQSDACRDRHRRDGPHRPRGGRPPRGGQHLLQPHSPAAPPLGRGYRGAFRDQVHQRPRGRGGRGHRVLRPRIS